MCVCFVGGVRYIVGFFAMYRFKVNMLRHVYVYIGKVKH